MSMSTAGKGSGKENIVKLNSNIEDEGNNDINKSAKKGSQSNPNQHSKQQVHGHPTPVEVEEVRGPPLVWRFDPLKALERYKSRVRHDKQRPLTGLMGVADGQTRVAIGQTDDGASGIAEGSDGTAGVYQSTGEAERRLSRVLAKNVSAMLQLHDFSATNSIADTVQIDNHVLFDI